MSAATEREEIVMMARSKAYTQLRRRLLITFSLFVLSISLYELFISVDWNSIHLLQIKMKISSIFACSLLCIERMRHFPNRFTIVNNNLLFVGKRKFPTKSKLLFISKLLWKLQMIFPKFKILSDKKFSRFFVTI